MDKRAKQHKPTSLTAHTDNKPIITVDVERYEHFLENENLTPDQKEQLLQAIWSVVVECVSIGFGVHPLQQIENPCGQDTLEPQPSPQADDDLLYLDHQFIAEHFAHASRELVDAVREE